MGNKIFIIISIISFALGIFLGASEYKNEFSNIKWTDAASVVVTFGGFILAFHTYYQWLSNKKKEDSYNAAKKHLASIDEVREILHDLAFHYEHMCPSPGVIYETKDVSKQRIEHVNKMWHYLYKARASLLNTKNELVFWNVTLTADFTKKHEKLLKILSNINVTVTCLNSQLYRLLLNEENNTDEVIYEKSNFDQFLKESDIIINERINMGFENVFIFKSA